MAFSNNPATRLSGWRRELLAGLRNWLVLGLVILLFSLSGDFRHAFYTWSYLPNIFQQSARNIVLAVGMSFVILTGGIDLSVGSVLALSGVTLAMSLKGNLPPWISFAAAFPLAVLVAWRLWRRGARQSESARRVITIVCFAAALGLGGLLIMRG